MATAAHAIDVRALAPMIGGEIRLAKDELLKGGHAASIRRALVSYGVPRFPGVNLDDHEQTLFARSLGEIARDWDVSADKSVNSNTVLAEY